MPLRLAKDAFVVFHFGRCGSTVLTELLNQSKAVQCDGEILEGEYKNARELNPALQPVDWVKFKFANAYGADTYGVEIKFVPQTHVDMLKLAPNEAVKFFKSLGVNRFVLLHRSNVLDRIVSQAVATARQSYHAKGDTPVHVPKVYINTKNVHLGPSSYTLLDALSSLEEWVNIYENALRSKCATFLKLDYDEALKHDPAVGAKRVAEHLGIPLRNPRPSFRKVVREPNSRIIENIDEVRDCLSGTHFEAMIE